MLLTARQVSEVLHVHVRVTRTRFSCTFQGTRGQSNAQVISGEVVIRLLVTYHNTGLRGVPQLREAMVLADYVGRRLARSR